MSKGLRLIVLGAMGRIPFAGMAWEVLHYLEGFRRLGHDVYYIEDTGAWPYDPESDTSTPDCSYTVRYIAQLMNSCGMPERWAYRATEPDGRIYGMSESRFSQVFEQADALFNLTASTVLRDEHLTVPVRVLLQTDPGGDEILAAKSDRRTLDMLAAHTHFFTFAENHRAADCLVPELPFNYRATRQPIVLDWYTPPAVPASNGMRQRPLRFTTVGNWQQSEEVEWQGEVYAWSKYPQFMKFLDVPKHIGQPIELALGSIDEEATCLLVSYGWQVVDATSFGRDILSFRDYIFGSDGEFTVAKDQYVRLRTGWFSERSASYLAAGKPVITQETGFSRIIPTGQGLFPFSTMDEIVAAFDAVQSDYARHSLAARRIAEEYFRAEAVLAKLMDDVGV